MESDKVRASVGGAVAIAFLIIGAMSFSLAGSGLSNDSHGYLSLSELRQPLYGHWVQTLYGLTGSYKGVRSIQVACYLAGTAWIIVEVARISRFGVASAAGIAIFQLVLLKMGVASLVGSLLSEGLFFPMIAFMVACTLAWIRTRSLGFLSLAVMIAASMSQLRTAALLIIGVPAAAAALTWLFARTQESRRSVYAVACSVAVVVLMLPWVLGKAPLQVGTKQSTLGFVLLPKISLLPVPTSIRESTPLWGQMSDSWRQASSSLSILALTQFDAQLQEAIRYDLAPKILLPSLLGRNPKTVEEDFQSGKIDAEARQIATQWIADQWPSYTMLCLKHLIGSLVMAPYMGNGDRLGTWNALNSIATPTWELASFRTDHPLNRIDQKLKPMTAFVYAFFRYGSMLVAVFGLACCIIAVRRIVSGKVVHEGVAVLALAVAWAFAHSLPIAMTYAPELRYVQANLVVMFTGGLAAIAYRFR